MKSKNHNTANKASSESQEPLKINLVVSTLGLVLVIVAVLTLNFPRIKSWLSPNPSNTQIIRQSNSFDEAEVIYSWGLNNAGQLGTNKTSLSEDRSQAKLENPSFSSIQSIAAGNNFTLAVDSDNRLTSWGYNLDGQLGQDKAFVQIIQPGEVAIPEKIKSVATHYNHSLALDQNGDIWSWGVNYNGQLGNGTNYNSSKPVKVEAFSTQPIESIATGYRLSLAIDQSGQLWAWGGNCGQRQTEQFQDFAKSLVGNLNTAGGYFDPTGATSAANLTDCLGEEFMNISSSKPKKIESLNDVSRVSAGYGHILALKEDGTVWSWGCNIYGQVGNGTNVNGTENSTPKQIQNLDKIMAVSAGYRHSLALKEDGTVWSWGHNEDGELGIGSEEGAYTPQQIKKLKDIVYIAAGHDYSLAIDKEGVLYGWGENNHGQLGPTEEDDYTEPVVLWKDHRFRSVFPGYGHVLATGV